MVEMSEDPDLSPDDELVRPGTTLRERIGEWRPVLLALLFSFALHAAFFLLVFLKTGFRPPLRVEFEASQGVALISQFGRSPDDERSEPVEIRSFEPHEQPEVEDAALDDSTVITEESEARRKQKEAEEAERERREQQARRRRREERRRAEQERQARQEAEAAAKAEASSENADSDDTESGEEPDDGGAPEGADSAPSEGGGADPGVPPAQRYPEGTLNPVATDVGMWGPEGARVVVILRNDRIRRSPHAESARRILSSFPDWQTLLGHADLDPLADIDTLLIASSDPRYVNRTFLAAVHTIPPARIVEVLSAGFPRGVTWTERDGRLVGDPEVDPGILDPRVFVLPTENVFVYSRPEFIAPLLTDAPAPVGLETAVSLAEDGAANGAEAEPATSGGMEDASDGAAESDASEKDASDEAAETRSETSGVTDRSGSDPPRSASRPTGNDRAEDGRSPEPRRPEPVAADDRPPVRDDGWMRGILHLADFGGTGDDGPAVIVSTGSIASLSVRGLSRALRPQQVHASVTASADPTLRARFVFADRAGAEGFRDAWPDILAANESMLRLTGLLGPLRDARWRIDHNEAILDMTISGSLFRRIALTISRTMRARH